MARHGISYEEVAAAAKTILQQGKNPTMERVRTELGGTGSFATINKYLNRWREEQLLSSAKRVPTQEDMIAPGEVSRAVNTVWEQLSAQAHQQVEKIQRDYEEKIAVLIQEKQQLAEENEQVVAVINQAKIKLNHQETDLALIRKVLNEASQGKMKAEEKNEQYEKALKTLQIETQSYLQTLEKIHTESLQSMQQQLEVLEKKHEITQADWKRVIEDQRSAFIVELDKLKTAKTKVEHLTIKQEVELKQQAQEIQGFEERVRALQFDLTMAQQRQIDAEKALLLQQAESMLKEKSLMEWQQKFEAAKEEIGALKQQILLLQE